MGAKSVKRNRILPMITILFYLFLGAVVGISIDKEWLSDEQLLYVQKLKAENNLLQQERQAWVHYMESELNEMRFFTTAQNEQFHDLRNVLAKVGAKLEELPTTIGVNSHQGIIITLGEELEDTYGLPQLHLDHLPDHDYDVNILYISILKMKEEIMR